MKSQSDFERKSSKNKEVVKKRNDIHHTRGRSRVKKRKISPMMNVLGYYIIEIPLTQLEIFLDLCLRYGFDYFHISLNEESALARIVISIFQKNKIITACRVWQIRVKSTQLGGFPKTLMKYKGRWGIFLGCLMSVALFLISQSVVWRIDIVGNERLTKEAVAETLSNHGLRIGARISDIDLKSLEQRVTIYNDDISWISVNISGMVARVEIREVIDTDIVKKDESYANLISRFDAQIVGMEVYSGFLSVDEGDFVRKGDLLVSGVYKSEKAPLRFLKASGRILGRVVQSFEVEIPLKQTKKVYTGEKIEKKTLIFFGNSIKLFINYGNLHSTCDIINYIYTLNPLSLGEIPISISVDTIYPYDMVEVDISEMEAMDIAYEELRKMIDEELPDAQILKKSISGELTDGSYILNCTVTAICDIAKQVEFDVVPK